MEQRRKDALLEMRRKCKPLRHYLLKTDIGSVYFNGVNIIGFPVFMTKCRNVEKCYYVDGSGKWLIYDPFDTQITNLYGDRDSILCPISSPLLDKYNDMINAEKNFIDTRLPQFRKRIRLLLKFFTELMTEVCVYHMISFLTGFDTVKLM